MKAQISDFGIDFASRKQKLTLVIDGDFRHQYNELNGKTLDVTFKIWREKRSLDANAYCWVLIGKIAETLNISAESIYKHAIKQIGVWQDVELTEKAAKTMRHIWESHGTGWQTEQIDETDGGVLVRFYYGSSVYNIKQMSRLIDYIIEDCRELGIETKTPEELALMMSEWDERSKS